MIQWILSGAAALIAALAFVRARRLARRLERLQESYWDLRYELGQLQARMNRMESDPNRVESGAPAASVGGSNFVPLSSLKR